MVKILCWNIRSKSLVGPIVECYQQHKFDVLFLLESSHSIADEVLDGLRTHVPTAIHEGGTLPDKTTILCSNQLGLKEVFSSNRLSIRKMKAFETDFLVCAFHGVDKHNYDEFGQYNESILAMTYIETEVVAEKISNVVVIGDFNLNPFDPMMTKLEGMNALMERKWRKPRPSTKVKNKRMLKFYNPMWSLFGDLTAGPPGTFYHKGTTKGMHGWNMVDQAIVSSQALPWFSSVSILEKAGPHELVNPTSGRPDDKKYSDHLPIMLELRKKSDV